MYVVLYLLTEPTDDYDPDHTGQLAIAIVIMVLVAILVGVSVLAVVVVKAVYDMKTGKFF